MPSPNDREAPRFWLGSASRDHVRTGVEGGFTQLSHGRPEPPRRMRPGDWIVYCSGRETFGGTEPCQRFTALGKIVGDEVYQVEMRRGFHPFRRDVAFCAARDAEIRPLLPDLTFVRDKTHWGFPFRRGHFEIPGDDFRRIAETMLGRPFQTGMRGRKAEGSRHAHGDR